MEESSPKQKIVAYIDGANLHSGSQELGFKIDYKKFYGWLKQKYEVTEICLFLGFVSYRKNYYTELEHYGYKLIFKETITDRNGKTKGNCDAELILKAVSDFYERLLDSSIIISGDGDFRCLIDFLDNRSSITAVLCPSRSKSSYLIRKTKTPLLFLDDHYHKFAKSISTEKAPDADGSA
jgi:uncharacterized LabA/DUF88 family protein